MAFVAHESFASCMLVKALCNKVCDAASFPTLVVLVPTNEHNKALTLGVVTPQVLATLASSPNYIVARYRTLHNAVP